MTVWPASFFFWGASGICRRLQPSPFDSPNQPARTRVVSVWNTTQAPPTTYFSTVNPSTDASVASSRGEEGFYRHFGTATLPTGASVASPRGEGGLWTVIATTTLPTNPSGASSRGEGVIYRVFGRSSARGPLPQVPQRHPRRGETVISPTSLRLVIFTEQANMPYTYL